MSSKSLEAVIEQLKNLENVIGLFTTGTTASGLGPSSDIDLVAILEKNVDQIKAAYTTIEGRFADIFFFDRDFLTKLSAPDTVQGNAFEGMFLTWLLKGEIKKDEGGYLEGLKAQKGNNLHFEISEQEKSDSWFKINYNFIGNKRYFSSKNNLYHEALEIRLFHSMAELVVAYFTLRDLSWRGEKEATQYLQAQDAGTMEKLSAYWKTQTLKERYSAYEELFSRVVTQRYPQWDEDFFIAIDTQQMIHTSLGVWKDLLV